MLEPVGAYPDERGVVLCLEDGESVHLCWCRLTLLAEYGENHHCEEEE